MKPSCVSGLSPVQQTHADDPHHDARALRCDRRHGARRRQSLGAPSRRRAREGPRPGARIGACTASRSSICLWPDDTHRRGGAEAAQGGALRPAGHRRRRTPWCCAATRVALGPEADVDRRRRRVRGPRPPRPGRAMTRSRPARRSRLYGGELLPEDRYEDWAEERREQLRLRHLDLLRLDGRWEAVVELDPSDELAHLALMRRHAAERRSARRAAPVRAHGPQRCAASSAWRPAARRWRCATACSPSTTSCRAVDRRRADRPRATELAIAERALLDAAAGRSRTLIVSGPAGRRQVVAARGDHEARARS